MTDPSIFGRVCTQCHVLYGWPHATHCKWPIEYDNIGDSEVAALRRELAAKNESLDALARQAQDASDGLAARQLACVVREAVAYVKLHDRVAYAPDELPTVHAFMARLVENGARLHGDEAVYAAAEAHGTAVRR